MNALDVALVFVCKWTLVALIGACLFARVIAWADTAPIRPRSRLTSFAGLDG